MTVGLLGFAVTMLSGLVGGALFVASGAALPRLVAKVPERASDAAA